MFKTKIIKGKMRGYKAFRKDLTCLDMHYEVGKKYEIEESPIMCERGFHFCKTVSDCFDFYPMIDETRICKVIAYGEIVSDKDGKKFCTNKIEICEEIENPKKASNVDETSTGWCNSGKGNVGNWNSGDCNTNNFNSGCSNTGTYNYGDWNTGDSNIGGYNTGRGNDSYRNSGDFNSGCANSGNSNIGDSNTGNGNIGHRNTGWKNTGDYNSGDRNSGDSNTGDWNSGNHCSGIFNTRVEKTIDIFDLPSGWTMDDWYRSHAKEVMDSCPYSHNEIITDELMTQKEKKEHPEYKTVGFFIKCIEVTNEEKQKWWDELPDHKKQYVYDLPNFNAEKFLQCTGIDVNKGKKPKK